MVESIVIIAVLGLGETALWAIPSLLNRILEKR